MTEKLSEIISKDTSIEKINQTPFVFLEGPVWDKKRQLLFFSDPLEQTILSMDSKNRFQVIYHNSGYANGMCLNNKGNLVICKMDTGSINEIDPETGTMVQIISSGYQGKPFHATNDVVCDKKGGYYFTDPFFTYGPRTQDTEATYYYSPEGNTIRVANDSIKPNGLDLSPDGKKLYIDDTGSTKVWQYDINPDGTLKSGSVFCHVFPPEHIQNLPPVQHFGESDGMKVDSLGNVYVTTFNGIQIFNPCGKFLGCIPMPGEESAANIVFGGADLKTMYITARTSLYAVRLLISGI